MKNKLFIIIVAILLILGSIFIICKKNKSVNNNEIVFWTLQMRDFSDYMNGVIADFERENPKIKVKWVDVPFSEGEKRTLAAVMSDNPPDLINLNPDFSALLAQRGTLVEFSDEDLLQFEPSIIEALKFDGKNYFIPWYATSALTYYNKRLVSKNHLKLPKSYEDIFNICLNGEDVPEFLLMPNLSENDFMLKLLNKYNVSTSQSYESPTVVRLFNNIKNSYDKNCFPKESITQSHRESLEKFMAGETVFFEGGANFLNLIKENAPRTFSDTDLLPQLTGLTGKYNFSVMNFIIPLKSKKHDEALKFALFLTNEKNQLELAKLTNVLATNKVALGNEFYTNTKTGDIFEKARILSAKQLKNLQPQPFYSNRKTVITLINNAIQSAILKDRQTEEILHKLSKEIVD